MVGAQTYCIPTVDAIKTVTSAQGPPFPGCDHERGLHRIRTAPAASESSLHAVPARVVPRGTSSRYPFRTVDGSWRANSRACLNLQLIQPVRLQIPPVTCLDRRGRYGISDSLMPCISGGGPTRVIVRCASPSLSRRVLIFFSS